MLIIHPFLTGRLARWKQVEAWIAKTQAEQNVWFATLDQIADHMDRCSNGRFGTLLWKRYPITTHHP